MRLLQYYNIYKKYPSPADTFEDAVNIYMGFPAEDYLSSAFWGTMFEWIALMDQSELYNQMFPFLSEDLAKVTKCAWFLRTEEEILLYDAYAMNRAGEGVVFEAEKSFEKFKKNVCFVLSSK